MRSCWLLQVVLASVPDLQSGFSRELFTRWCEDKKNTIILTNRTTKGTLACQLIENSTLKQIDVEVGSSGIENVNSFAMCFPELLNRYLMCCRLLYVPGNSRTMHCGILFKVFYLISFRFSWICYIPVSCSVFFSASQQIRLPCHKKDMRLVQLWLNQTLFVGKWWPKLISCISLQIAKKIF